MRRIEWENFVSIPASLLWGQENSKIRFPFDELFRRFLTSENQIWLSSESSSLLIRLSIWETRLWLWLKREPPQVITSFSSVMPSTDTTHSTWKSAKRIPTQSYLNIQNKILCHHSATSENFFSNFNFKFFPQNLLNKTCLFSSSSRRVWQTWIACLDVRRLTLFLLI